MTFEVELKFRLDDPELMLSKLDALHAERGLPAEHRDCYYRHPSRDFATTNEAFRVRRIGDANRVTYKGPVVDTRAKVREEIEIEFASGPVNAADLDKMLVALGFSAVRTVAKTRVAYHLDWDDRALELAYDVVEGLGPFLEIETLAEEADRESARDCILQLAQHLGLENHERKSYLSMLLERDALA